MKVLLPDPSLVVLVGPSGAGKSTFARRHFKPTEVLSSDACRALVSDDERNMEATDDAFAVLHLIARKRLAAGKLTVIDATNVQPESRESLIALAAEYRRPAVAVVLDLPEALCRERNLERRDRTVAPGIIRTQLQQLHQWFAGLEAEGFAQVVTLSTPEEAEAVAIERQPPSR